MSLLGASNCSGYSPVSLRGRLSVEAALQRLLRDAPCDFQMADEVTVRIVPRRQAAPRPQSADPAPPPLALSEVTVIATKRRQTLDELAAAVTVLSAQTLQATGVDDAGQAASHVPGLLTTNLGPGRDKILLRGLSDGAFNGRARSTVATLLDAAPINYSAPDPDLRLVDVEQVEVVRGPQGALYGAGSLGGVYRIVTNKPDVSRAAAGFETSYAWSEDASPTSVVEGYASVPVIEGKLAVRLVAYREVRGGFLDNANLRRADVDTSKRQGVRMALRYQPNAQWTVDLAGAIQDLRSNDSQYSTDTGSEMLRNSELAESHDNHFSQAALTVTGQFDWGEVTSSTSYVRHGFHSQYDATVGWAVVGAPETTLAVNHELTRNRMVVQELTASSAPGGRFSWLAGLYAVRSDETTNPTLEVSWTDDKMAETYLEMRRDVMQEGALYGELAWKAAGWRFAFGGRIFENRQKTRSDVVQEAPWFSRSLRHKNKFSGSSLQLSAQRTLSGGQLVYALYSEGYRPGGINTAGLLEPWEPWSTYESDRLHSVEIGGKGTAFDGRLSLQSALFYERWNEVQSDQFLWPTGFTYTTNVGDADLLGLELEANYDTGWGLSLKGNALLTTSRVFDANPWFARRVVEDLPGTPRFSGGLQAMYQRHLAGDLTLRVVADMGYVGRSNLSFDAYLSPRMGDFLRTRLSAQVIRGPWALEAFLSNPANTRANTFAYGNPWSLGLANQVTPLRPRTLGVGVSAAF